MDVDIMSLVVIYLIGFGGMAAWIIIESLPRHNNLMFEDDRKSFRFNMVSNALTYGLIWPAVPIIAIWYGVHKFCGYFLDHPK